MADAAGGPLAAAAEPDDHTSATKPAEATAIAAAKASGERVEVVDKRGVDRQVFAEPDGTLTAEVTPEPVRAKNESGDWAPIDLTLEHVDGRLAPRNVPGDVTLSAGGDRAFAKANPSGDGTAQDIVWQWPTTLPAPVIDGATATYRDAAAGGSGDLVVIATATGFTHNVVLHEPPAADAAPLEFTIPVITPGAEISETASGALELKDTDNGAKLVTAPTPVMWDSSGTDTTDPDVEPVTTTVVNTAAGSNLVLTPSPDFLTDPNTEYPVTIDPSFTQSANGDTWIQNAEYTTSQGGSEELRAGTYDSGDHIARSYLQFPSAPFTGKHIRGASLWIRNHFSKSCTGAAINATRIIEPWSVSNLTWANRPNFTNTDMGQFDIAYGADGCPADGAHWDVTEIVNGWANGTYPNYGIQLRANNETYTPSWRKYRSINYPDPDVGPRLVVNYNNYPATATGLTASPLDETNTTITRTPVVSAQAADVDRDQVQLLIRAYSSADASSTMLGECTTALGGANVDLACTMPPLPNNQTVHLRAKAVDKHGAWAGQTVSAASGWSSWRTIHVARPVVSSPVVDQIVALTPDATVESVTANIEQVIADAAAEEAVTLTFAEVADAMLTDLTQDVADVKSDYEEAQDVTTGDADPEPVEIEDPGTDDAVETVPDGETLPAGSESFAAADSGGSSGPSSSYINLPKARRYGDIVVSPNKGPYGFPHGHAAIFTSYNWIAQAPGGSRRVEVVHRLSPEGQSFVPGSKMMSVFTDEGDGPLLSFEKREKAANWAMGRRGDRYRGVTSPNAFRVTAPVGSDDAKQNCSQLVYGAYNYANGYKFNPVEWTSYLSGAQLYQDKKYVWPKEIEQADQTKVYRTVYTDSTS